MPDEVSFSSKCLFLCLNKALQSYCYGCRLSRFFQIQHTKFYHFIIRTTNWLKKKSHDIWTSPITAQDTHAESLRRLLCVCVCFILLSFFTLRTIKVFFFAYSFGHTQIVRTGASMFLYLNMLAWLKVSGFLLLYLYCFGHLYFW